jgi:arylsulfatase
VVYTTDNGPNQFSWPDAATTPFRNEKNSNWEGAYRVPAMVRWPARSNRVKSPTRCSRAGLVPDAARGCRRHRCERQTAQGLGADFRWHQLQGASGRLQPVALPDRPAPKASARVLLLQRRRRAGVNALRQLESGVLRTAPPGGFKVWSEPFVCLRVPKIFNLRMDPYERPTWFPISTTTGPPRTFT